MSDDGNRWTWVCKSQISSSYQKFCFERTSGCGDGRVSGVNANGDLETCDEGGRNILCEWTSSGTIARGGCDINFCVPCGEVGVKPTPPGCGPSDGSTSNDPPVDPLCVGGAVASNVTVSSVGSSKRYDWTCTAQDTYGDFKCSSGRTSAGGNPTAVCGPANGVPSSTKPQNVDLCATGQLTSYGVTELTDATSGEPLWYWSCAHGTGVMFSATSCYAPRITGIPAGQACTYAGGTATWGENCSADIPATTFNDGATRRVMNTASGYTGSIVYKCTNGAISEVSSSCQ